MAIAELTGLSWGAVNTALKAYGAGGFDALRPKARGRLKHKTTEHMKLIESSPDRVIAYFGDPKVSYAANHK